ncbi:MAG: leucyl/phenylalanyl-tRNA--protein transferase [Bilophila sp.]
MIYRLHPLYPVFPDPEQADANGLLAVGGDLAPQRLLAAYRAGIFPWYDAEQPLLWWSPDPRCVILPEHFRIPHTVRKELRDHSFEVTFDYAFVSVMRACAQTPRTGQGGTWILDDMIAAYTQLYQMGYAHSVEVWELDKEALSPVLTGKRLVGGLYGVALGQAFFGESMFHLRANASKLALVRLMDWLHDRHCTLLDCQMETPHIMRYGATCIARKEFLTRLREAVGTDSVFL